MVDSVELDRCKVFCNNKGEICVVKHFTIWWVSKLKEWKPIHQKEKNGNKRTSSQLSSESNPNKEIGKNHFKIHSNGLKCSMHCVRCGRIKSRYKKSYESPTKKKKVK